MEAVGLLAAGVAHDFNNLLAVILGYNEQVLTHADNDQMLREDTEAIQQAAVRATDLTRQLLAFSRKQPRKVELLDLNSIINSMAGLLKGLVGPNIELTTILDPALFQVLADRGQVEQVLVNLATNARDAMTRGGRLAIQTSIAEPREE